MESCNQPLLVKPKSTSESLCSVFCAELHVTVSGKHFLPSLKCVSSVYKIFRSGSIIYKSITVSAGITDYQHFARTDGKQMFLQGSGTNN